MSLLRTTKISLIPICLIVTLSALITYGEQPPNTYRTKYTLGTKAFYSNSLGIRCLTILVLFGIVINFACTGRAFESIPRVENGRLEQSEGQLNFPRYDHHAIRLNGGKVLVFGGRTLEQGKAKPVFFSEVYNPTTKSFRVVGPIEKYMDNFSSKEGVVLLKDGKVLITGGLEGLVDEELGIFISGKRQASKSAFLYDPDTETFTKLSDMAIGRAKHESVLLPDGKVLLVGGINLRQEGIQEILTALDSIEIYNPKTQKFSLLKAKMKYPRAGHKAVLMSKNKVYIFGGQVNTNQSLSFTDLLEVFDVETSSIEQYGKLPYLISAKGVCEMSKSLVLIHNIQVPFRLEHKRNYLDKVIVADFLHEKFDEIPVSRPYINSYIVPVSDDVFYIFGGIDNIVEKCNVKDLQCHLLSEGYRHSKARFSITNTGNKEVIIIGGIKPNNTLSKTERYIWRDSDK